MGPAGWTGILWRMVPANDWLECDLGVILRDTNPS